MFRRLIFIHILTHVLFLEKLIAFCLSTDVNLKILRDDSTCPEACRVIQW